MAKFLLFLAPIKEEKAMYGAMPNVWDCKLVNINDERWKTEIKLWCKKRGISTTQLMVKDLKFEGFSFYIEEEE